MGSLLSRSNVLGVIAGLAIAAPALADPVSAVITADNHYALFTRTASTYTYIGGNELGAGGSPGTYNWSVAEPYSFALSDYIYIATWSDGSVAQGLLAQINLGFDTLHSGDSRWEVYSTGIDRNDGDPHPTVSEISGHVFTADTGNLWIAPHIGGANGINPWGTIAGITAAAKWMWYPTAGDGDPLDGGSNEGEMLIFRVAVPAPGAAALLGLGGLAMTRRRRR